MKKNIIKIAALSLALLLVGCDKVTAQPQKVDDKLVTFTDGKEYFRNDVQYIYDQFANTSDFNTLTIEHIINKIVEAKVNSGSFFENVQELTNELIEDKLLETLNSDSYKTDGLFSEKKFLNAIKKSVYKINVETTHEEVSIKPDTTVKELLGDNYRTIYADYIDNELLPDINKKLLTARYICENSFSSLGRAYARRISYVKLENIEKQPGAAGQLINDWLGDFINDPENRKVTTDDGTFSLDSLARIYKGIKNSSTTTAEEAYIDSHYTLSNEIADEINKICDVNNNYVMKPDIGLDKTIEDKYTGNGTYTISWGHELALRDLSSKKISDSGLFTKTNGISDLPTAVTDRLFSSSVSSYLKEVSYRVGTEKEDRKINFLTPLTSENKDNVLGQYYFFDSDTNAYYIVVVDNYKYTSTNLKETLSHDDKDHPDLITGVKNDTARIAIALSSSSSYSKDSINEVLKEANVKDNIHDQRFYDYMAENYGVLFE